MGCGLGPIATQGDLCKREINLWQRLKEICWYQLVWHRRSWNPVTCLPGNLTTARSTGLAVSTHSGPGDHSRLENGTITLGWFTVVEWGSGESRARSRWSGPGMVGTSLGLNAGVNLGENEWNKTVYVHVYGKQVMSAGGSSFTDEREWPSWKTGAAEQSMAIYYIFKIFHFLLFYSHSICQMFYYSTSSLCSILLENIF